MRDRENERQERQEEEEKSNVEVWFCSRKGGEGTQTNINQDEEDGNNPHKEKDELKHCLCRQERKRILLCGCGVVGDERRETEKRIEVPFA